MLNQYYNRVLEEEDQSAYLNVFISAGKKNVSSFALKSVSPSEKPF